MAEQSIAKESADQINLGIACEQGGRPNIEDRVDARHLTTDGGLKLTVAIVADGVGGSNYGERAAELAVQVAFEEIETSDLVDPTKLPNLLRHTLEKANDTVFQEGRAEKEKRGMGSTAVIAAIHDNKLYLANVGDSRAYLIRGAKGEQVIQLTRDHTWAREMVTEKRLSPLEANNHPKAEELVRSIGYAADVKVDLGLYQNGVEDEEMAYQGQGMVLAANDRLVLCSDGLIKARHNGNHPYVTDGEIAQIVTRQAPEKAAPALVQLAISRHADDNVSAVVLEMPGSKRAFFLPPAALYGGVGLLVVAVLVIGLLAVLNGRGAEEAQQLAVTAVSGGPNPITTATLTPPPPNEQPINPELEEIKGPTQTILPDGTQLILGEGAVVGILKQAEENGAGENELELKLGSIVVATTRAKTIVRNQFGSESSTGNNGRMGVTFNESPFRYEVICFVGECIIAGDLESSPRMLAMGEAGFVGGSGTSETLSEADYASYYAIAPDLVPPPTATPTETATPTPTETPTNTPTRLPTKTPTPTPTATATNTPLPPSGPQPPSGDNSHPPQEPPAPLPEDNPTPVVGG